MNTLTLTYGRREWVIELLLLLGQGVLIWLVAAMVFAPFSSLNDPVAPWLAIGLVAVAALAPRLLHDHGIWGWNFSLVVGFAIVATTLAAIKLISFPGLPWLDTIWLRETVDSLVLESSGADIVVWAPIGFSAVIWWLARFNGSPGLERCRATLRTGAAVAAVASIASALAETGPNDRAITIGIVVFFTATLVALAIARQGSEATHTRRRLLSTVLLPTIAIVSIASLLALLGTFDWRSATPHSLSPLGTVLDPVFQLLLILLTGLVILIFLPLLWLFERGHYDPRQMTGFNNNNQNASAQSALDWHPPDPVRYLLAALFLIAIFYGVARFGLAITRRDLERAETGDRQIGPSKGFGKWLDRFRWPFGRAASDPLAGLRGDPAWANTVRIRETYGAFLRWSEERQRGRDPSETVMELDHRSGPFFRSSTSAQALDELTAIYDDIRYARTPATAEQADRAVDAWRRLESAEVLAMKQP